MGKEDYTISDIYQGGYSSLKPNYGDVFTGYSASARGFGLATDPRTANILQEASSKLSTGAKQIEISTTPVHKGDSILLCSDGLSNFVDDNTLLNIVVTANQNLSFACQQLIDKVKENQGNDNATIVLAHLS